MKFIKSLKSKFRYGVMFVMLLVLPVVLLGCKYQSTPANDDSSTCFTINFYNSKNVLIKTVTVNKGETAVEPTAEEKYVPGYIFLGWDTELTNIQSNLDVYGFYSNDPVTDTDGDGIIDYLEIEFLNLNYLSQDSDGDSVLDGDEDFDNDGLTNIDEIEVYYSKPHIADTDGDGLNDGTEVLNDLDPNIEDTDGDGLTDGEEIDIYWTLPNEADTDGDGVNDGDEINNGTDPLDEESF